jgi:hypothetical protein
MRLPVLALIAFAGSSFVAAQESPDAKAKRVLNDPRVTTAMAAIDRDHDRLVADIVQLTQIPHRRSRKTSVARRIWRCCGPAA